MVRKPRRTICRTKLGKRMHVRIPQTSHSLRQVVLAVCQDQNVSIHTLRVLDSRVTTRNTDEQNWTALTKTVNREHLMQALATVCARAQTGPVTSFVIQRLRDELDYGMRERAEAQRNAACAHQMQQRHGQAFLAACEVGGWLDHGATVGSFV